MAISLPTLPGTLGTSLPARPTAKTLFAISQRELQTFFGRAEVPDVGQESVLISGRQPDWQQRLEELQPEVIVSCWSTQPIEPKWLADPACSLRYVCHLTGSVRGFLPRVFLERGGLVTNWGGLAAPQVAEHALLLVLAALRNLPDWRPDNWNCKDTTRTLFGKTVGLHGFGKIARCLRELLRPFGVTVRAFSQGVPTEFMLAHEVEPCSSLKELFSGSDVLVECEALTPESTGSVDAGVLAQLQDGAVFVNVGRGALVDEVALIREAQSGRINIALDVVTVEPLSPDSPLAKLPNVIYSPHLAGPTGDQLLSCGDLALANLDRYFRGLPLDATVNLEIYDRAT